MPLFQKNNHNNNLLMLKVIMVYVGITLAFSTAFKLGSRDSLLPAALKVLPAAVELLHSPAASGNALIR